MKYFWTTIRFFRVYWAEIRHAASLTVDLWLEIMKLAPVLAEDLRQLEQFERAFDEAFAEEAKDDQSR